VKFLQDSAKNLGIEGLRTVKADVFTYLDRCAPGSFDFIFADPPYDLDRLTQLPAMVFEKGLLKPGGLFVLEFPSTRKLPAEPVCAQVRKYGNSSFAIYLADA